MCFEKRDAALAAACKERDDLKKRLAAATEVWGGLKEEMENEISRLKTIAEKQAEMNQRQNELAKVKAERDALVKIVGESSANCDYCKHVNTLVACSYGVTCAICKCADNCVCGKCECGSGFEYIGLEGK